MRHWHGASRRRWPGSSCSNVRDNEDCSTPRLLGDEGDQCRQPVDIVTRSASSPAPMTRLLSEEEKDSRRSRAASRPAASGSSTRSTAPANMASAATDWAVHVGLAIDGVATDRCRGPARPRCMRVSEHRPARRRFRAAKTGRSAHAGQPHPPRKAEALAVAKALGAELRADGFSAGAKAMAVLSAARPTSTSTPAASMNGTIARRRCGGTGGYGLHASRVDGAPLVYNQRRSVYIPDLLICRQEWAERLIAG